MYSEYKESQEKYRSKTKKNKFTKEDFNSGKKVRKNRESDTMAMLSGFKNALFDAKNPKAEGKGKVFYFNYQLFNLKIVSFKIFTLCE